MGWKWMGNREPRNGGCYLIFDFLIAIWFGNAMEWVWENRELGEGGWMKGLVDGC